MRTRLTPGGGKTRIYMSQGDRDWVMVGWATDFELEVDDYMDAMWGDDRLLRVTKPRKTLTLTVDLDEMYIKDKVPAEGPTPVTVEEVAPVVEDVDESTDIPADWKML